MKNTDRSFRDKWYVMRQLTFYSLLTPNVVYTSKAALNASDDDLDKTTLEISRLVAALQQQSTIAKLINFTL